MKEIVADTNLVAFCGLYCGACKKYLAEKCPGCRENERATWCKVRTCALEHGFATCAECSLVDDFADCGDLDNFMAKFFAVLFRSNRMACLRFIQQHGADEFAREMTLNRTMTIKR